MAVSKEVSEAFASRIIMEYQCRRVASPRDALEYLTQQIAGLHNAKIAAEDRLDDLIRRTAP